MNKYNFELLNDNFINLYKQWIFIRCYEYSAIIISEITWYRVYPNVDKKTWFVYLELWYPKNKENIVLNELEKHWYNIRVNSDWNIEETIWKNKLEKNKEKLISFKKQLIKFN